MFAADCDFASEISNAASRSAAFSSAIIGRATLVATSPRFAKVSGRLLQAGEVKVTGVVAEFAAELFRAAGEAAPTPAVTALAISFLLDQTGVATGSAWARAVELFVGPPLPLASPKSASNSSRGARRPA